MKDLELLEKVQKIKKLKGKAERGSYLGCRIQHC